MSFNTNPADQQALDQFAGQTSGYYPTQLAQQLAMFQQQQAELQREFNLNYTNNVAQLYGYNNGLGQPASPYAPTESVQNAQGAVGYIPGQTGYNVDQTLAALNQYANLAAQQSGITGAYTSPGQSQYSPGTFVQLDPNSQQAQQFGQQLAYVLPSGQIQRVTMPQAQAMGYKGSALPVDYQSFMSLSQAPPQGYTTQSGQQQQQYFNENQAAQQAALQASQATGMYTSPAQIQAPGYAIDGSSYFSQSPATQQAYLARYGNPQAAQQAWVNDTNAQVTQYYQGQGKPLPFGPGTPTETQQAQQQYFNQALQLAGLNGVNYTPGAPGSPNPTATGQETLAAQQQYADEANMLAQLYGQYFSPLIPGQAGQAGVNAPSTGQQTLGAQQQAAQLSGMYNGNPTEQAREFNAQNAIAQGNLGLQYLTQAAQLQGPQNVFQLSNFNRGAQGNQNVPVFLQALANNNASSALPAFQGTGSTAPTPLSMSTLQGGLLGSGNQGFNANQSLNTIAGISNAGAGKLAPGTLERLTPEELQAFGSGLGAVGNSLPSFLQQYQQSRPQQSAMTGDVGLAA